MARPIVETYQTKPEDFEPSPEQIAAYKQKLENGQESKPAAECKQLRRQANYSRAGWCWHARILDARTGDLLFDSPLAWKSREYADRHGQRLIRRFKQTGSWTEKTGVVATPAS